MAGSFDGVKPIGDYSTGGPTNAQKIDRLIALIPNPDSTSSNGSVSGGGFFDEMSPQAAIGVIVELRALKAALV